jgi:hypothetical protein
VTLVAMLAPALTSLAVTAALRVYWPATLPVQAQANVSVAPPAIRIGAVALGTAPVLAAAAVQLTPAPGVTDGVTAVTSAALPPAALASTSDIVTGSPAAGAVELAVNVAVSELMTTATGAARLAVTASPVRESTPVAVASIEMFPT